MRKHEDEQQVRHECGATSSKCPDFAQIPLQALIALATRFELGAKKHGRDNYRKGLDDKRYVIERLNHTVYHALKLIAKLEGHRPWDNDDDAGAIMWGGTFAVLATEIHKPKEVEAAA